MAKLAELRKKAKGMGISAAVLRRATTASELQAVINDHAPSGKAKATAKAKGKSPVRKVSVPKRKPTARKNSGRKASTPAKSKGAKAKRSSTSSTRETKGGRNLLGKVNYSDTEGWNPRKDSAPDLIIRALRKFKGNRTKVFEALKGDIWDFVAKKKQDGSKRTKAEAESMLRYRISRTAFDFAIRTGQHEPSTNRVEYGTGGTGNGTFKPKKAVKAPKPAAKKAKAKVGRKPVKAQKGAQRGRKVAKRGRPKAGSRR